MQAIAGHAPTSIDELADCEIGENVKKQYGERLLKNINNYIETEKLQKYIENRSKKKPKTDSKSTAAKSSKDAKPILIDSSDDEFDDGIDYSALNIPEANSTKPDKPIGSKLKSGGNKSTYFK